MSLITVKRLNGVEMFESPLAVVDFFGPDFDPDDQGGIKIDGVEITTLNRWIEYCSDVRETESIAVARDYGYLSEDDIRNRNYEFLDFQACFTDSKNLYEKLGHYLLEQGMFALEDGLESYFNFKAFGHDYVSEDGGQLTEHGYITRKDV